MAALLGGMLLGMGVNVGPVRGLHTIRARDNVVSPMHEACCSFVVQHLHWSRIEPLQGEYLWEHVAAVLRALLPTDRPR